MFARLNKVLLEAFAQYDTDNQTNSCKKYKILQLNKCVNIGSL